MSTDMPKKPLAERMRPQTFEALLGQEELIGEGRVLRTLIDGGAIPSLVFWGPPGCGKTTLARLIAKVSTSAFVQVSAVTAGKADVRKQVETARQRLSFNRQQTLMFVDEIHRWSKVQQDALLPHVEDGTIVLIGATTENPSFEIIAPLLSRCRVFVLKPLAAPALREVLARTLRDAVRGLGGTGVTADDNALDAIVQFAHGDVRVALNGLEIAARAAEHLTVDVVTGVFQTANLLYDKKGEEHYNCLSAFIKSLRGSDADAALYWCARMLVAGEDPMLVARRMVVLASEDIGNADPQALVIATATMRAVHMIGMPEARIILAQAVTYLARAKKSNHSYVGMEKALADVQAHGALPVPLHLRNAPTALMKDLGYGKQYIYSHTDADTAQQFLPDALIGKIYYDGYSQ